MDPKTANQSRHIQDVAYLLSAVDDPVAAGEKPGPDVEVLRQLEPRLRSDGDSAWDYSTAEDRRLAQAVLDFL